MATRLNKTNRSLPGTSDIPGEQEKTRGRLAMGLLILFAVALLICLGYALYGNISAERSDLVKYFLSGLVGLIGVVVGFYFGQSSK